MVHSSILISLKDLANSYKQFKSGRKIDLKKASFKKFVQKKGHSISSSTVLALLGYANNGFLVQIEETGTLCFKEVFCGMHSSFLIVC